jgi:hypothetical protein
MILVKSVLTAVALAVGLAIGIAPASADPAPEPTPSLGEQPPNWAPRKPADVWSGQPVVWTSMWGGRWGVWINGAFITLSANPVTNGG